MASIHILLQFPNLARKRSSLCFLVPLSCNALLTQKRKAGSFLCKNGRLSSFPPEIRAIRRKGFDKGGNLQRRGREASLVVVRAKQKFNSDDGGWDKSSISRALGNLTLALGLAYLTVTGQLGWLLDALVSLWILAFLLPIVGLGAFFWFAGRDIIQSNCPNCGNYFQILKSSMKDGVQFCPYCTQPFSVEGNKFEREPTKFSSKRPAAPGQVFSGSAGRSKQGASATAIVDIEAEVKDIE